MNGICEHFLLFFLIFFRIYTLPFKIYFCGSNKRHHHTRGKKHIEGNNVILTIKNVILM